jgi:hypothetical protein
MSASIYTPRLRVADLLRQVWPRDTSKHAARASGQSHRSAEAWITARCTPSADTLLRMAAHNDTLRAELVRILTEIADAPANLGRAEAGEVRRAALDLVGKGGAVGARDGLT